MKRFLLSMIIATAVPALANTYRGDFNNDGVVDMDDMVLMAKAMNSGNTSARYDLNTSGNVDDADLHILANIILNKELSPDTGVNIGIGGWDDDDEDYGGSVSVPLRKAAGNFAVTLSKAGSNSESTVYTQLQVNNASSAVGMLVEVVLPQFMSFDNNIKMTPEIDDALCDTHKFYGTPVCNGNTMRLIVFSKELKPFATDNGNICRLSYSVAGVPETNEAYTIDTQWIDATKSTSHTDIVSDTRNWADYPGAISNIIADNPNGTTTIYSLSGQRIAGKPTHGIFICNGKKFLVK